MLTFKHLGGSSLSVSGGPMNIVSFPAKPVDGAINLHGAPQEIPSREHISWPGEYDVAGVGIRGIGHLEGQRVSYAVTADGYRIAFICSPIEQWEETDIEHLGDIDVLVLPAEDVKKCQRLLDEIDPRMLILVPGSGGSLHPEVLKACGAADKEHVQEYKLKGSLPQEGRETVVIG